ncbi:hypothetical protein, variant 2 [Exophiala mesophila]|nr:hypothetical protein, variant 1 [Exophiala mesophila]XP_016223106.1 hypothetical protein, variant 2 [Exophiala mesophila]KIV91531.1 hypothetical protein, variant 1 [Exophiala mesophila]KIV91532.1 hypothetical protein, variant 2 [Exophiala mesophila]
MVSPFSYLDDWEMNATVFQDTLFIEESHEKKLDSRQNQYTAPAHPGAMSQDLMSYWGYKFETVALLDKPWSDATREDIESREKMVVSNYAQYCSIVRTGFGKVKIVIGGEVDAVQDFKPVDKSQQVNWVELKTTALIQNEKDQVKFERKLLKFWAQSFLLGVPKIVVGYRNHQGLLERVEELDTQAIPEKVRLQGRGLWDGQACINFASSFLEWLKGVVVEEGVWKIRKREKSSVIEVYKAVETGHGDILSAKFVKWRLQGLPQLQQGTQPPQPLQPSQPMEQPQDGPT